MNCHKLSLIIVIRNRQIVWKAVLSTFLLELELSGVAVQSIHKKSQKNCDFCEELLSEKDFEAVLTIFCCYDYSVKASEAVQKIATDQKKYHKCTSRVIIC